jgi:monoamine oxidase
MVSEVDVAIIGAGPAGLSAAQAAKSANLTYVVLEAKGRIGGRAYTESASLGLPMDHGAHFLHSASNNPFTELAEKFKFVFKKGGYRTRIFDGSWLTATDQKQFEKHAEHVLKNVAQAADIENVLDTATLVHVDPKFSLLFNSYYEEFLGAGPAQVAAAEHQRYQDTYEDWPVEKGFGALVARFGRNIPVVLDCPVTEIDHSQKLIRIRTPQGTVTARTVIVTVSAGVLASELVKFTPPLSDAKHKAINAIPMGYAGKIAFSLKEGGFADVPVHQGLINRRDGLFANLHVRPFDRPMLVAIVGGPKWEMIERAGSDTMTEMAKNLIWDVYGASALKQLDRAMNTSWVSEHYVRGGHSYMRPGFGNARAELATPIDGRIYFAGEACSQTSWATVHGAHETACAAILAIKNNSKETKFWP